MTLFPAVGLNPASTWTAIGPPLVNHLWQSTLFAALAGVLTLTMRSNYAKARYWLWLSASLKFLVPFSLLVSTGRYLFPVKAPALDRSGLSLLIEQFNRSFAPAATTTRVAPVAQVLAGPVSIYPMVLLLIWSCGFVSLLCFWGIRWRRMLATVDDLPVTQGREYEALERLKASGAFAQRIKLIFSKSSLEPGIIGILHPVMVLPAGISDRLTDSELEAIITHEICHVRRRDNLTAALHMVVEALFWFHPLIWWIGARLIAEREWACDEEVLAQGNKPQVYAESILKVCKFYLESPLRFTAGVTGSNLKRRIEAIMISRIIQKLETGKKILLASLGAIAIIGPVVLGALHPVTTYAQTQGAPANSSIFESISITPKGHPALTAIVSSRMTQHKNSLEFRDSTLKTVVQFAYHLDGLQISGGPDWINSDLYDVSIGVNESASEDQVRLELQKLLAEGFKLAVHRESKQLPVLEMVVGPNGSKLTEVHPQSGQFGTMSLGNPLIANGIRMESLRGILESRTGRFVIDDTGLKGIYNFTLTTAALDRGFGTPEKVGTELSKAVSEQLGLQLNPETKTVDTLVIDHAEPLEGRR